MNNPSNERFLPGEREAKGMELTLKRAIIVGASSGIGAAIAAELAKRGYATCLLARRADVLADRCSEIAASSTEGTPEPIWRQVDVRESLDPAIFSGIVEELGGLDALVYVAGYMSADQYDSEQDRATFEVNTLGAMDWLNQGAAYFEKQGSGALACVSSVAGDRGRRGKLAYCASKAAVNTFMEGLRNTLAVKGISVTTIKPGFVDTPMTQGIEGMFWVVSPEFVAERSVNAMEKGCDEIYVPSRWRLVMWIIRNIPSLVFRRLNI